MTVVRLPSRLLVTLACVLIMLLMAACGPDSASTPIDSNAPILAGVNDLPKILVTVWFSPTPNPENLAATPLPTRAAPTATPEPLDPTQTPTPYAGVFVGTQVDGTPEGAAIQPIVVDTASGGIPVLPASGSVTSAPGNCPVAAASTFNNVIAQNSTIAQQLGCPRAVGQAVTLVYQPFERGKMFWRETRQIYALLSDGTLTVIADTWQEGMPANDPAFAAPAGLLQPVRGFGLAWRSNETVRNALGWALQPETSIAGFWQDYEGGAMFVGESGLVYAIVGSRYSGPFTP